MANTLFERARQGFANKEIDWDNDDIRVIMVDLADVAQAITGATNASPIVITYSGSDNFANGDIVMISGVGGNTAANGRWTVANVNTGSNTFELSGSTGNGAYTSGGFAFDMTGNDYLDDLAAGGRVAVSGNLASKTNTLGVLDATDVTLTAVSGDTVEALIGYLHTGTESTSLLIWYMDSGTGLPFTPNGGDVTLQWSASGIIRI